MAIDSVIPWYESNRLAVNTEKSSVMLIGQKTQIRDNNLNIYINNVLVNETDCTKYLGLFTPQPFGLEGYCRHGSGGRPGGRLPNLRNPYLCNRLTDFLHSKFYGIV